MIPIKFKKEAFDYHLSVIFPSIKNRIKDVIHDERIYRGTGDKRKEITLSPKLKKYLEVLKNDDNKLIEILSNDILGLRNEIINIEHQIPKSINRSKKKSKAFDYIILYSIFVDFGYEAEDFDKLTFIKKLGIDTCPYCNRNYIYTLEKEGKIKPQIDHFYPKSIYPLLAASFYNLIPSCETCNGFGGKGSEDTFSKNVINPYLLDHKNFRFSYDIISLSLINPISSKGSIKVTLQEKETKNAELFKLKELYEKHEDHVLELIYKSQIQYSETYREHLNKFNGLHFSKSEIDRMIIGNYAELDELHKRPLSKLYRDIAIELGLITPNDKT